VFVSFLLAELVRSDSIFLSFIDEVCHLPITLQLLRCLSLKAKADSTQHHPSCQGFVCFSDKSADVFLPTPAA
jgi:hypothetical protein